jgi:N-acetylneuraminate synthase
MTYIIAEIGINHNGSVAVAKHLIDVAKSTGCDAVKFQKRTVDLVYSPDELMKPRESPWGSTFGDQKRGLEFCHDDYGEIDRHCMENDIQWFASPWDVESVAFLSEFDIPFIKVPSALITNAELARVIHNTELPVMLSTGMSTVNEINNAVIEYNRYGRLDTLMHCTSTYPSVPSELNLSVVGRMAREHMIVGSSDVCYIPANTRIGFSNHYSGITWAPVVVALGAKVVEFHITLDRTMYGTDQAASIEPDGVRRLVEHIRLVEKMLGDGVKQVYDSELPILEKLRK